MFCDVMMSRAVIPQMTFVIVSPTFVPHMRERRFPIEKRKYFIALSIFCLFVCLFVCLFICLFCLFVIIFEDQGEFDNSRGVK